MLFQRWSQRRAQRPPVYECATCASRQAHESRQHFFSACVCRGQGGMRRNTSTRFKDTGGSRDTQDTHGTRGRTKAPGTRKKRHRGEPGRTRDTVPVGILPRSGLRRNHLGGGRVEAPAVTGRSSSRRRLASCSDVCVWRIKIQTCSSAGFDLGSHEQAPRRRPAPRRPATRTECNDRLILDNSLSS